MYLIKKNDDSDFELKWNQLCKDADYLYPFYYKMNLAYFEAYARDSTFTDCSFVIEGRKTPLLGIRMAVRRYQDGSNELSCFGLPILYLESQKGDEGMYKNARKILKSELKRVLNKYDIIKVIYRDLLYANKVSFVSQYLLDIGAVASHYFTRAIDLSPPESKLHQEIRKSYKSLINWGKGNLLIHYEDADSVQEESIERFRQLHIQAAGRETRSQETWSLQYEMVRHGEAFLVFGEIEGKLVTAALFTYSSLY